MHYTSSAVGHLFVIFHLAHSALNQTHRFDEEIGPELADVVIDTYLERGLLNLPLAETDIENLALDSLQRFFRVYGYRLETKEIVLSR